MAARLFRIRRTRIILPEGCSRRYRRAESQRSRASMASRWGRERASSVPAIWL
jgi:hypothetical protein